MIDLTIDVSYLSNYFGLSSSAISSMQQSQGTDETEGMLSIETEDGTITVNAELLEKLLHEPEKLAKILKLTDAQNRYLIIQEFNEDDLTSLLPYLSSDELMLGLQYFTMDGLENLMTELPTEELVGLVLQHFSMENIAPLMDQKEVNDFLQNTELEESDIMEYFTGLEYEKFQNLMVNQFGIEYKEKTSEEYLEYIDNMDAKEFNEFLMNMKNEEKINLMSGLCEINPDYYMLLDNSTLTKPMMTGMEKTDIIKTMGTLDAEFLVPMIEELPMDLMQIIATQIDPTDFSEILSSEFPDLMMEMLAG